MNDTYEDNERRGHDGEQEHSDAHEHRQALRLTVLYNGIAKTIDIDRGETVKTLLERSIAMFGSIPAPHTLSLWTANGVELTNELETLKAAHIKSGDSLLLRPGAVKGG